MILDRNDVVLISHRRLFQHDEPRFFLGRAVECEGSLMKVEGFSFVSDLSNGHIVKKEEKRTKLLSLASPGYIVYQLPQDVNVEHASIKSGDGEAILVDGSRELMNLSERTHCGHF
jgi:hypothetical protein